jgi:DNA/RNA-binding domain of Phe-tRNA-synthetase-like protein
MSLTDEQLTHRKTTIHDDVRALLVGIATDNDADQVLNRIAASGQELAHLAQEDDAALGARAVAWVGQYRELGVDAQRVRESGQDLVDDTEQPPK